MNPYVSLFQPITIELMTAHEVATYSSLVQKTLTPLDVSACEYSSYLLDRQTIPSTAEALRKLVLEPNRIIDTLHLDSPSHFHKKLSTRRKGGIPWPESSFLIEDISVNDGVYRKHFDADVIRCIERSQDKLDAVKKYLKALELMGLCKDISRTGIYGCFLDVLVEEDCEDSDLVVRLFRMCGNYIVNWMMHEDSEPLMDYVLLHSQKMDFHPFAPVPSWSRPVSTSIFFGYLQNIPPLLKYGYPSMVSPKLYTYTLGRFLTGLQNFISNEFTLRRDRSNRRTLLLAQLVFLHYHSSIDPCSALDTVQLLWRTLPDIFLDYFEVTSAFQYASDEMAHEHRDYRTDVWGLYAAAIGDEADFSQRMPRTLAHLCRCYIRGVLRDRRALPHGIDELGLPRDLESYLRLEI